MPNLHVLTTYCVCLELRSLPSAGITPLQRYYGPLRHPKAPGLSLAGVRLIILITHWGFPCCVRFPCVHAAATTPVQQMGVLVAQTCQSVSAFPDSTVGSACTSTFSRFARRSLALRPAHSRSHQIRGRYPGASDISSPPCLPRLLPAGAIAGWALHPLEKRRLVTAHEEDRRSRYRRGLPAAAPRWGPRRTRRGRSRPCRPRRRTWRRAPRRQAGWDARRD